MMKPVPIDFPVEDLLCYCGCICMCAQGCVCVFTHVCAQGCVCVCPVRVRVCVCVCVCTLRGRVCLCQGLHPPARPWYPGAQGCVCVCVCVHSVGGSVSVRARTPQHGRGPRGHRAGLLCPMLLRWLHLWPTPNPRRL